MVSTSLPKFTSDELYEYIKEAFYPYRTNTPRRSLVYHINELRDYRGWNALHVACVHGELGMVKWLIHSCALSPTFKNNDGVTPIHYAIFYGYPEIVEFLVEYDGSLISSLNDSTGEFPLHVALRWNKLEIADVLLTHGANVLQPTEQGKELRKGRTPLHIAVEGESLECLDELLNYLDVDSVHPELNKTPIQIFLEIDKFYAPMTDRHVWQIMEKMLSKAHCLDDLMANIPGTSENLLESCFRLGKSKFYFDALIKIVIQKIIDAYGSNRDRIIEFTRSHLSAACREKNMDLCKEIIVFLSEGTTSTQKPDIHELHQIIHPVENDHIFNKTALNYAIGADLMANYLGTSENPLERYIRLENSELYFDALIKFGIQKIIDAYGSNRDRIKEFTRSHLSAACRENNMDLCREIIVFLNEGTTSTKKPDIHELHQIIHYTVENHHIFSKTALNYANQYDDRVLGLELLQLEKLVHLDKNKGLSCIKETLDSGPLLSWIIQRYKDFFPDKNKWKTIGIAVLTFIKVGLLSFLPLLVDLISDINLASDYARFGFSNETVANEEIIWNCTSSVSSSALDSSCFKFIYVLVLWILGIVFQILHYKFAHQWSDLNGVTGISRVKGWFERNEILPLLNLESNTSTQATGLEDV
ncbi:uncharacterized protein LOC111717116 [Eurytemora carolleeae]|uniref:uncharacterized protein LOC111717116 n=1 Tax=Eurytemora carolleeae TaxID=1294199 RepID=UPI000C77DA09|nr:uncharacterized protein LOC111717116 [Eurytemora carolleeae]|eukprot:XP_023348394.1 uncharacterized protein LOC111717116 [Eurytemora affinis]